MAARRHPREVETATFALLGEGSRLEARDVAHGQRLAAPRERRAAAVVDGADGNQLVADGGFRTPLRLEAGDLCRRQRLDAAGEGRTTAEYTLSLHDALPIYRKSVV